MKTRLGDDQEDGRTLLGGLGVSVTAASNGLPFRSGGASVLKRQRENRTGVSALRPIESIRPPRGVLPP